MKLLWISHFLLYPETGFGALERSRNLLCQLAKHHEIYLVSYYRRNKDLRRGVSLESARRDLEKYCKKIVLLAHVPSENLFAKGLKVLQSLVGNLPYSALIYRSSALEAAVLDILEAVDSIDLVHVDTIGLAENILGKINAPKALTHHNAESAMMRRRATRDGNGVRKLFLFLEALKLEHYERKHMIRYDLNVCVSELDKESLVKCNPSVPIEVIENGVDCSHYRREHIGGNMEQLVFMGSLDWYPNRDAMLFFCMEVWPILSAKHGALTLTIIGKNCPPKLAKLVAKCDRITLAGYLEDVRPVLKGASIFICPIRDGGGTRLKLLSAMAYGIPIVSTSIGCEGLEVEHEKHLLIADAPEEFCVQVGRLLKQPELRRALSENAFSLVQQKYSYDVIGKKITTLYENLVSGAYRETPV